MKRHKILATCMAILITGLCMSPFPAFAADEASLYLNIATIDSRPISNDRLLYNAFQEVGYQASFTTTFMQACYEMTNTGVTDGVVASTPDIEKIYDNLIKVPVLLEKAYLYAFIREDSGLVIDDWDDLKGRTVGIDTQRPFTLSQIPKSAIVVEKETAAQVMEGLVNREYDVAVFISREHETLRLDEGIVYAGMLSELQDYLYLNKKHMHLVSSLTTVLDEMFADGRGEDILNDIDIPNENRKKTVLHILSSNLQIAREEKLSIKLREPFEHDDSVEWYTVELSSRSHFRDSNRLVYFANLLRQDFVARDLEAIVVSGDDALQFLESNYYLFFRNVPVLFYGVNEDYGEALQGYEPYFTGIQEKISAYETVKKALKLFPDTKKLYVVNDYMTEGNYYRAEIQKQLEPFADTLQIEYNENVEYDALFNRIKDLPADTVVLTGSYFCDSNWQHYPQSQTKRRLERDCKVPVFSLYSTDVDYNAVGGKSLDYEATGEIISGLLERVLNGENPADIPVLTDPEAYSRWAFDKIMLDRMGISESALPVGSLVVNKTPSIWESDPRFARTLIALLVLAIVAAASISFSMYRYRRQQAVLANNARVREVKERLELIINTAPVAFALTVNGRVVEANEYIKKNMGVQIGDDPHQFYTKPDERDSIMDNALVNKSAENQVVQFNTSGGEAHRFLTNISTVEMEGEQGFILWAMDIEERERQKDELHTAQEDLRAMLDSMPVPVGMSDNEGGGIIYANRMCLEMFGFQSMDEIRSKSVADLAPVTQSNGERTQPIIQNMLLASASLTFNMEYLNADGALMEIVTTTCKIRHEGKSATIAILIDMSEERKRQKMLLNAAEKEKEANQLKSRFLVNMSHEIRTPMNAIIGLTEIELHKNPPKETKDIYKKINISAKNLLDIINDILDLSKIEADKIELYEDEFELEDVLNSALLVAAPRLDGKDVEFLLNASLELPKFVVGDRTRTWQILKNFLDNSAKYTDNGKIVLTAYPNAKKSNDTTMTITFIIEDSGIGMNEEQMQKLFAPYEQVHNEAQKKYSGTGLGMAISKQLCEIMGGTMQVESKLGEGTTVIINLPFIRSKNSITEMQAVKASALSGLKVLAVDDDDLSLSIMENLLKSNDVDCMLAKSGMEAMEIILEHRDRGESFDVILLDYLMEGLSGVETAKQIHLSLSKAPKLLMVTAYQKLLLKHDLEDNGIDDIVEKPFIPSQFVRKLCTVLGFEDENEETVESFPCFEGVNLLLCEDYRLNQEVATGMFAQFGIVADIADNGAEGIKLLNSGKKYDLIFMDIQMPIMDGYETTRIIRADPRFNDVPIVSLTADAMKEVVERCLEIGMNDHIAKPIEFESLNRVFLKWLPASKRANGRSVPKPVAETVNGGLARFGGNKALYEKALVELTRLFPKTWPDFDQALKDQEATASFVHKLKGASGNLAEQEVYQGCADFEASLRAGTPDRMLYEDLVAACKKAKERISLLAQERAEGDPEAGTAEELGEILTKLKAALQNYDPKGSSDAAKALRDKSWPMVDAQKLKELYALTRKYEFDDALELLDTLGVGNHE